VDYPEAVQQGEIVNQGEYAEMVEFAARIDAEISDLDADPARDRLSETADRLKAAVDDRADPVVISQLTRTLRETIMQNYDVVLVPSARPDLRAAAELYESQCASCHGVEGMGNGAAAEGMEPPPTDFRNVERAHQRTLYGLYNTITLGVEGTAMAGRPDLSDEQRWALAFYTGAMHVDPAAAAAGESAWRDEPVTLEYAVTRTPGEFAEKYDQGEVLAAWTRTNPDVLFTGKPAPLEIARESLRQSLERYLEGNRKDAQRLAIHAYLEGFEMVEAPLGNLDAELMRKTERSMMAFRHALREGEDNARVQAIYDDTVVLLQQVDTLLSGDALSPTVAFTGSLIILLREGLEAILVLAAILAFLSRSGRRDAMKYVHGGWIVALIAGAATWIVSSWVINISGATREITEGFAALAAAVILLYVGFWMHRNSDARRWNRFIEDRMKSALTSRTLWTLCLVAFLAVYREIFETILFYQALWAQVDENSRGAVFYGGGLAAGLLILISWAVAHYSVRLPLKQFFLASAFLMVLLAFVFTGKGVTALQEAGRSPSYPVDLHSIGLVGIYPNAQALILQALVLCLAFAAIVYERFGRRVPVPE
ncbi:MAG: FTR1 family protein, partial [Pseudomonadales bacterium]|nr:FTR1 family protein [Pseudomonadales bacterium]